MKRSASVRTVYIVQAGLIAAVYTAVTVLLQPFSFGAVQVRAAELLTVLPVYTPAAIPGLAVGCFLSNLLCMSANPAGGWDLLLGTAATLSAAVLSYVWRKRRVKGLPVLSTLPPVIVNAFVVGSELSLVYGGWPWSVHVLSVAAGQAVACIGGGLIFAVMLQKTGADKRLS